jgi:Skp family chaperone for outer membrane proteins
MKKLFKVALVAAGMLFAGNFAQAQTKIGHINFEQLVGLMPETKTLAAQIDAYKQTFVDSAYCYEHRVAVERCRISERTGNHDGCS